MDTSDLPPSSEFLELVATALEYPDNRSASRVVSGVEPLSASSPGMSQAFERLAAWLDSAAPGEAEERYTSLFDLSPVCTLHAGYHVFGETYQRGALLAGLVQELRKAGVSERGELPDFLPTLLRLLPRQSRENRATLVDYVLLPALARMRTALEGSTSPWADILRELPKTLAPLGTGEDVAARILACPPDGLREYTEAADLPERGDRHAPVFVPPAAARDAADR
jgi:nitrate reductase delta subunit